MDFITVVGRVTGKPYMIPVSDIGLIEGLEDGSNIHIKEGSSFKYRMVECIEDVAEIRRDIGSLN